MNVLTHNGEITLTNPKTGGHRTFRIKTCKQGNLEGKRILSMLIGQNNENDYLGIGFVTDEGIQIWRKHQGSLYEKAAKCLLRIEELGLIQNFEGKCRRCNRKLTVLESVQSGIGPECAKK